MEQEQRNRNWKAWSQVVAAFLIQFCTLGLSNSWGVFQSYYEHDILSSDSSSNIAWIGTTQGFLLSVTGLFSGPIYDKGYGRRLIYIGTALSVLGLLGTSVAEKYVYVFLAYGMALGIGCGLLYIPAQVTIQDHFSSGAPLATGLSMTGSSIGGVVYPLIFHQLLDKVGFPWTCRVFALVNCVLLGISGLLMRPQERIREDFDWDIRYDMKMLLFGICALVLNVVIDIPLFFTPTFVREKLGLPPAVGDALLTGINGSSFLGRIVLTWLAGSYFGSLNVWQFTILASSVLLFCWFTVANLAGMIAFVIVYGFLVGGLISLIPSAVRDLTPEGEPLGIRLGTVEVFQGFGFLVGPPMAGAILDLPTGYLGVSMFCGSLYFALFLAVGLFTWRRRTGSSSSGRNTALTGDDLELQRVNANNN
ncbi:MFS general substrate transporter [Hypomontagnella monticulosa]|nr:MFS general substrate transporter [Hypomontagnella monticulosa]